MIKIRPGDRVRINTSPEIWIVEGIWEHDLASDLTVELRTIDGGYYKYWVIDDLHKVEDDIRKAVWYRDGF